MSSLRASIESDPIRRQEQQDLALRSLEGGSALDEGTPIASPEPMSHNGEPPPRPRRRSSIPPINRTSNRISMVPSELQNPITLVDGDPERAQALIGSRRISDVPRCPHVDNGEPTNSAMAWFQTCLAVLIVFNCWGLSNEFGLMQTYYHDEYLTDTSPGTISWLGSTQLGLVFLLGVPVGRLVDKGYFRLAFHGGSILMIVGLFCSSFCTDFASLWLVQGLFTGCGMGLCFTAGLVALMGWFDERTMGLALGLPAAGSCLGGIVYILIARLCLPLYGYGTTVRILSAVVLGTMIPPNLLFRERRRRHRPARATTQRGGFGLKIFADAAYWLAAAGMFFSFLGLYFGFIYLVSCAVQVLHLSDTSASNMLIYMLVANIPGRLVPAFLADRYTGPINIMIPATILSSVIIWIWAATTTTQTTLTIIACLYGFVSGAIQALYAPSTYSFCLESANDGSQIVTDRIGLKAGGIFSLIGVGVLIGTPIGGALISYRADRGLDDTYLGAELFAGVSLLLGGCFLTASRVKKIGFGLRRA